jgi:hypothetical protein
MIYHLIAIASYIAIQKMEADLRSKSTWQNVDDYKSGKGKKHLCYRKAHLKRTGKRSSKNY